MKFSSGSVIVNGGVNHRVPVAIPSIFKQYKFPTDVFKKAIEEFNSKLKKRPLVTMKMDNCKVDIIRLVHTGKDTMAMWLVAKEKDIDILSKKCFTIKGDVYFEDNSEVDVFHMIIKDVTYDNSKGIFTK